MTNPKKTITEPKKQKLVFRKRTFFFWVRDPSPKRGRALPRLPAGLMVQPGPMQMAQPGQIQMAQPGPMQMAQAGPMVQTNPMAQRLGSFECGVVPQARANAQVKTLHKRVLNSPLLGGCFFQCVCQSACPGTFQKFKQPGDPHFLLSQSIEEQILRTLTEGIFEIRFLTVRERNI